MSSKGVLKQSTQFSLTIKQSSVMILITFILPNKKRTLVRVTTTLAHILASAIPYVKSKINAYIAQLPAILLSSITYII